MFRLAQVMARGAQSHGDNNWRRITVDDHLNHALAHIYGYLAGDGTDDHLGHALTRLHMAVDLDGDTE